MSARSRIRPLRMSCSIAALIRRLVAAIRPAPRLVYGVLRERRDTAPMAEPPRHLEVEPDHYVPETGSPTVPHRAAAEPFAKIQFWGLQADSELTPGDYRRVFVDLQRLSGPKVLDLTAVRLLSVDLFGALARAWTTPAAKIPRLALVLSFERWVMLLRPAIDALQPLTDHGVELAIAYQEQYTGKQVASWIATGDLRHNAPAVIATLRQGWRPSHTWPNVVHTLADLVRADTKGHEAAVLLVELAALALRCGGPEEAVSLAQEALTYLPATPSVTRSRALRHLGSALVRRGRPDEGAEALELAIAAGLQCDRPVVAANPLYQRGQHALDQGDVLGAERRFREALALLAKDTRRRALLRQIHRGLALALRRQGQLEAVHHARSALALNRDPNSEQAALDQLLVDELSATSNVN